MKLYTTDTADAGTAPTEPAIGSGIEMLWAEAGTARTGRRAKTQLKRPIPRTENPASAQLFIHRKTNAHVGPDLEAPPVIADESEQARCEDKQTGWAHDRNRPLY